MKTDCDVIRDLLPLYADRACSEKSRALVEEHLEECASCRGLAGRLREHELENTLRDERESVIDYGARRFRRRSTVVGSTVSGVLLVPILICLILNLVSGPLVSWVSVVMAACFVPISLILVPIAVPEDKAFWTFCAFTASLIVLLGMVCLYDRGNWFYAAASAVLLGLSVVFLPFLIRARPLKRLLGNSNRWLVVLGTDFALFFNLLNAIGAEGKTTLGSVMFFLGALSGVACVVLALLKNAKFTRGGRD